MSATVGADDVEEFAARLRDLKDRSGLSYGTLAKRLHMSTSTLHRYCNGTAVPPEYAPVERLARACKATPEELVDLHRHWILADTARRRRAGTTGTTGTTGTPTDADAPGEAPPTDPEPSTDPAPEPPPRTPRRRAALLATAAVVATALGATALIVNDPDSSGSPNEKAAGAHAPTPPPNTTPHSPTPSRTSQPPSSTPSPTPSTTRSRTPDTPAPTPLTVGVRPFVYETPCSQDFLVNSEPEQVGPPATEPNAPRWVAAYGAVSANQQVIALTVQGTGAETVVLESLDVRILTKNAPLAWNVYGMGSGCGGNVETRSFTLDLDQGSPAVAVKGGQRKFPYKVSESDPEVFYLTATTKAHDVRWDLSLKWSSGNHSGTLHVDDSGTPFHTSADDGRHKWDYPLGGNEWIDTDAVNGAQTP